MWFLWTGDNGGWLWFNQNKMSCSFGTSSFDNIDSVVFCAFCSRSVTSLFDTLFVLFYFNFPHHIKDIGQRADTDIPVD